MNTAEQYRAGMVVSILLLIVGFLATGTGFGFWLSVQTMLDAGCQNSVIVAPTDCQQGMQTLSSRSLVTSLTGLACAGAGAGILAYLRRQVV
jgi:hypothetical protein